MKILKIKPIVPLLVIYFAISPALYGQPLILGITADWPLYRSQLIRYAINGSLQSSDHVVGQNVSGVWSLIENIKGICKITNTGTLLDGKYFITTGNFNDDTYFDEKLLEIDPTQSSATIIGPPIMSTAGTVRDICFINVHPGIPPGIYGIKGGNELIRFNLIGGALTAPVSIGFFTAVLPLGYSAWGLTWTICSGQPELIITARSASNHVKYYKCNPNTAMLTFGGDILPTAPAVFSLAHCGVGWLSLTNALWINGIDNTNPATVYKFGQSMVAPWCPGNSALVTAANSPWSGRNIEDFCSEL